MDFLWDKITEWLKEMLIGGIVSNLSGMFDATNQKVAEISGQVGLSVSESASPRSTHLSRNSAQQISRFKVRSAGSKT